MRKISATQRGGRGIVSAVMTLLPRVLRNYHQQTLKRRTP